MRVFWGDIDQFRLWLLVVGFRFEPNIMKQQVELHRYPSNISNYIHFSAVILECGIFYALIRQKNGTRVGAPPTIAVANGNA